MRIVDLIIKKKQNGILSKDEIHYIIDGYVNGSIPDYQISALLMAICFNGLNREESINLTLEMLESGEAIDLSKVNGICVDKHSTGGVGDKTTLVVAPIIAACGLKVAKMSGRGLGHTGGTLDKLESIPDFNINQSSKGFIDQVNEIGLAVIGQTANITPADKKLYALRDVTGTVESIGLIAASIMSKKLASGAHFILLDVKVGKGAFMKNIGDARLLARMMVDIGNNCGRKTVAVLTDMEQPLGNAVGNSIEVIEAIETLKGNDLKLFSKLCYELSAELLMMTNLARSKEEGLILVDNVIKDGSALNKLKQMIMHQGGNAGVIDNYSLFPQAKERIEVISKLSGYVHDIDTLQIGNAAMVLGAGRKTKDENIDLAVGIEIIAHVGDYIKENDLLAIIYSNKKNVTDVVELISNAYEIINKKVGERKIILDIIS